MRWVTVERRSFNHPYPATIKCHCFEDNHVAHEPTPAPQRNFYLTLIPGLRLPVISFVETIEAAAEDAAGSQGLFTLPAGARVLLVSQAEEVLRT